MEKLAFWIQFYKIKVKERQSRKLYAMMLGKSVSVITSHKFSTIVLDTISQLENSGYEAQNILIAKFKVYYFNELIKRRAEYIRMVSDEINNKETWKFAGYVVDTVIELAKLKKIIKKCERDNSRIAILTE
jgi:hypothetical protein